MGRQAFRQRKSDGTIDDGSGGGASFMDGAELMDFTNGFYAQCLFPYGNNVLTFSTPFTTYVQYYPFVSPVSATVSKIGTRVSSGYGGTSYPMYIGIYTDVDGSPTSLIGKVDLTINGNSMFESTSISSTITLVKGTQYWVAWLGTGAKTGSFWGFNATSAPIIDKSQNAGNQSARKVIRSNNNATALPSTTSGISGYWGGIWPQVYIETN